jgi:hypothetical protein
MSRVRSTLVGWLVGRLARLRFPVLFAITAAVFLVNLVVPDALPFVDEILLGLGAAVLASLRKRAAPGAEQAQPPQAAGPGRGA